MKITRQVVGQKLIDFLQHKVSAAQLVDWAEAALMDGELEEDHFEVLRDVLSRVGVADVRAFGLTWEDFEDLLSRWGTR